MPAEYLILAALIVAAIGIINWFDIRKTEVNTKLADTILSHVAPNKRGRITGIDLKRLEIRWESDDPLMTDDEEPQADPVDPRAADAVRLIRGCIEIDPHGTQIIPAGKVRGMSPETWSRAVAYLIESGFALKVRQGAVERTEAKQSFARILAQLPAVDPEVLDRAVHALPRAVHQDAAIERDGGTVDHGELRG